MNQVNASALMRHWRVAAGLGIGALAAAAGILLSLPQAEIGRSPDLPFARAIKPRQLADLQFQDGAGRARSLADFCGKLVLLNIWATWCAPCREEMPALDRLQAKLGGPDFEVLALSIDQQGPEVVRRFFAEIGVKALALYIDPTAQAGFKLAIPGVPTTLLIDRDGREIWRRAGPAKWDAPEIAEDLGRHLARGAKR